MARRQGSKFEVSGTVRGRPARLRWEDGRFLGDDEAVLEVEALIRLGQQVHATAEGPSFTAARTPGYVALLTADAVFDRPPLPTVTGDVRVPTYPGGATV